MAYAHSVNAAGQRHDLVEYLETGLRAGPGGKWG
jgi:hypothetical protein